MSPNRSSILLCFLEEEEGEEEGECGGSSCGSGGSSNFSDIIILYTYKNPLNNNNSDLFDLSYSVI